MPARANPTLPGFDRPRVEPPPERLTRPVSADATLPVVRVGEIPSAEGTQRWLVEGLWGDASVGVIGGAPKCAKTWLGLDLALSVATGSACLGRYGVPERLRSMILPVYGVLTVAGAAVIGLCLQRLILVVRRRRLSPGEAVGRPARRTALIAPAASAAVVAARTRSGGPPPAHRPTR